MTRKLEMQIDITAQSAFSKFLLIIFNCNFVNSLYFVNIKICDNSRFSCFKFVLESWYLCLYFIYDNINLLDNQGYFLKSSICIVALLSKCQNNRSKLAFSSSCLNSYKIVSCINIPFVC